MRPTGNMPRKVVPSYESMRAPVEHEAREIRSQLPGLSFPREEGPTHPWPTAPEVVGTFHCVNFEVTSRYGGSPPELCKGGVSFA